MFKKLKCRNKGNKLTSRRNSYKNTFKIFGIVVAKFDDMDKIRVINETQRNGGNSCKLSHSDYFVIFFDI